MFNKFLFFFLALSICNAFKENHGNLQILRRLVDKNDRDVLPLAMSIMDDYFVMFLNTLHIYYEKVQSSIQIIEDDGSTSYKIHLYPSRLKSVHSDKVFMS